MHASRVDVAPGSRGRCDLFLTVTVDGRRIRHDIPRSDVDAFVDDLDGGLRTVAGVEITDDQADTVARVVRMQYQLDGGPLRARRRSVNRGRGAIVAVGAPPRGWWAGPNTPDTFAGQDAR